MNPSLTLPDFVQTQIFGTTFEITTRYLEFPLEEDAPTRCRPDLICAADTLTSNQLEWAHLGLSGTSTSRPPYEMRRN